MLCRPYLCSMEGATFASGVLTFYENPSIIESVDSICRNSADTQYMLIQKKFLKISKTAVITPEEKEDKEEEEDEDKDEEEDEEEEEEE